MRNSLGTFTLLEEVGSLELATAVSGITVRTIRLSEKVTTSVGDRP